MHENFTIFTRRLPPLHGEEYSLWMKIGCEVGSRLRETSEVAIHHANVSCITRTWLSRIWSSVIYPNHHRVGASKSVREIHYSNLAH